MAKIHTKLKRALKLRSTTRKHRFCFTSVTPKKGAKSFRTKETAEAWAKDNVDTKTHILHETPSGKFQWRAKPRP